MRFPHWPMTTKHLPKKEINQHQPHKSSPKLFSLFVCLFLSVCPEVAGNQKYPVTKVILSSGKPKEHFTVVLETSWFSSRSKSRWYNLCLLVLVDLRAHDAVDEAVALDEVVFIGQVSELIVCPPAEILKGLDRQPSHDINAGAALEVVN